MIWSSMPTMIVLDLIVIGLIATTLIVAGRFGMLGRRGAVSMPGRSLIVVGAVTTGLFYLTDLVVMTVIAEIAGRQRAMELMTFLHLELRWVVSLLSLGLICAGIVLNGAHRRRLDQQLRESEAQIAAARDSVYESEIRFRSLVEQTPDSVYCFEFRPPVAIDLPIEEQIARSYDAVLIECNQAFAESLGKSSAAAAIGTAFADMDSSLDTDVHERFFRRFIENGYRLADYELAYTEPNGESRALLVSLTGVVQRGALVRIWGAEKNIEAQKRTEAELSDRHQFQRLVAEISSRLVTTPARQIDKALTRCIEQVCLYFGFERATLVWIGDDDERGDLLYHWNEQGTAPNVEPSVDNYPWIAKKVLGGEAVVIGSVDELPDEAARDGAALRSFGLQSTVILPLMVSAQVLGAVSFGNAKTARHLNEVEMADLRVLANLFANVVLRILARRKLDDVLDDLKRAKERLEAENVYLREEISSTHGFDELVGESKVLRQCLTKVSQVAATTTPVLIQGETGTGKELIARAIHERSTRSERPLVKVNCAALPPNLIESELFGHEKGAFTGAMKKKRGRFDLADGGTLFLDEIGDFPLELQGKLLRVLQEGEFQRVGGSDTIRVDVRLLAATNRNLQEAVDRGEFRADLFYRINTFPVALPPLSEREGDVPLLAEHFVRKHAPQLGKEISAISATMMEQLCDYSWPGNVRELEGVIQRALISSTSSVLELAEPLHAETSSPEANVASEKLELAERSHIESVLQQCRWVVGGKGGAAERLGIPPSTLRSKMKKLGIERPGRRFAS